MKNKDKGLWSTLFKDAELQRCRENEGLVAQGALEHVSFVLENLWSFPSFM